MIDKRYHLPSNFWSHMVTHSMEWCYFVYLKLSINLKYPSYLASFWVLRIAIHIHAVPCWVLRFACRNEKDIWMYMTLSWILSFTFEFLIIVGHKWHELMCSWIFKLNWNILFILSLLEADIWKFFDSSSCKDDLCMYGKLSVIDKQYH